MIWNPSTHQQLACPDEHPKPGGSSWRCPITVNGVVHNWGAPGSCGWGAAGCGWKGALKKHRQVWDVAGLYCSQQSSCSPSWWSADTLNQVKALPCWLLKASLCHNHPLHLSPPHRARRTRSLRTVTRGFSMGSAQEGETGHCWVVHENVSMLRNPWGSFLKETQVAAFSFQFPFLRLTPFFLFLFFKAFLLSLFIPQVHVVWRINLKHLQPEVG